MSYAHQSYIYLIKNKIKTIVLFLSPINILERILKDHVTLKTWVIMLKILLFITGINYIKKNIQIEIK